MPCSSVGDFGLFRIRDGGDAAAAAASAQTSTNKSGYNGTPAFSAPESFVNRTPNIAADVYSLAVTVWVICTGQRNPYPAHLDLMGIVSTVSSGTRPSLTNDLPQRLQQLIQRAWQADPQQRCTTAEMISELRAILAELPV